VESNNGGRGFARNVERNVRIINEPPITTEMKFISFNQGANKNVRIFSHSAEVQNMIYYPTNWERKWPKFASAVKSYRKTGSNAHDDAPDVLTGMVEFFRKESMGPMKAKPVRYTNERR
jgi:predicted phage terminase large subunit-like protein